MSKPKPEPLKTKVKQKAIYELMRKNGITQIKLGEFLGLHQAAVSRVLNNKQRLGALEMCELAGLLGVGMFSLCCMYKDAGGLR